jgi:transglutaminase-like putative cysteine protease
MRISVGHVTRYSYAAPVRYAIQALRLTPPSFDGQRVIDWRISGPGIDRATIFRDGFGNLVHLVTCSEEISETVIIAKGVVETADRAGIVQGLAELAPRRVFERFTPVTAPSDGIRDLAAAAGVGASVEGLHTLMKVVRDAVSYEIGTTGAHTSAAEALADGKGVCQDHAHIFISAARCLGIPARYVNGYMLSAEDTPAEAHHAWAEAWVDGLGWVGFDPSNLMCPTDAYIRLATGLDANTAAPIRGHRHGLGQEQLDVIVEVQEQRGQQQQ